MTQTPSLVRPWPFRDDLAFSGNPSGIWVVDAAGRVAMTPADPGHATDDDLLLREMNHRYSNDLQLVVGLLVLQGKRASNPDVRQAIDDAIERVSILSRARRAMSRHQHSLEAALRQVCEALHTQAEHRSVSIVLDIEHEINVLSERQITTLALVVNELATNAIKHAFGDGKSGRVRVSVSAEGGREVVITVDDDGLPFTEAAARGPGVGLGLAKRLIATLGGVLIPPPAGTKTFELRVPLDAH